MGDWRNIVKKTYKNTAHIDRQTGEKMRKTEAITGLVSQGATLLDRYVAGKKDQAELEAFGASQGLEYDKKTKSYSGFTKGDDGEFSAYRIKSADLKNMRELSKYSDDTFQDFITNKQGGIKSIYEDKERPKYLIDLSKEPRLSENRYKKEQSLPDIESIKKIDTPEMTPQDTMQNKMRDYFGFNKPYELSPEETKRYNRWSNLEKYDATDYERLYDDAVAPLYEKGSIYK